MTEYDVERPLRVKRIVANIEVQDPAAAQAFYGDVFGLSCVMDFGWITTFGHAGDQTVQVSFANEGGSGTVVPGLTIEVDDLGEAQRRCETARFPIVYGPVLEPWGIRRFFVRDPFGTLVNITVHEPPSAPDLDADSASRVGSEVHTVPASPALDRIPA